MALKKYYYIEVIKMKKYFLYKHTFPNGKVYIGITSRVNPERRWLGGRGY